MTKASGSLEEANEHRRAAWAKMSESYDKRIGFFERRVFGLEHRGWACSRADGTTLEVAIGTGLNIEHYAPGVKLTGLDLSEEMLAIARKRADHLGRDVDLQVGDAHALEFEDESFDAVVCTYSLCNIPDPHRAVGEMERVLRPGGKLILVDHIRSAVKPVFWMQKIVELFTIRADGDHMTRRPLEHVKTHGFEIAERERLARAGVIERLVALKR